MARPKSQGLTENELLIMKALWAECPLGVADIVERMKKKPKPAYTSVLTAVQTMEKKGYLRHESAGKAYVYSPVLSREEYEREEVVKAAKRIYDGNPLELAINLVRNEHLSAKEIKELKKILEEM